MRDWFCLENVAAALSPCVKTGLGRRVCSYVQPQRAPLVGARAHAATEGKLFSRKARVGIIVQESLPGYQIWGDDCSACLAVVISMQVRLHLSLNGMGS